MYLAAFIVLVLLFAWRIKRRQKRKARHAAWLIDNQREAERLVAAGQLTAKEARWMIRQGLPMPVSRHSSGGAFIPAPSHDADVGYVQEPVSSTSAFWEQMEAQRQLENIRRREEEQEQQWRDEENHRRDEVRQREDEYWAERQRDNY